MIGYKKAYCDFFGYDQYDQIPSEVSGEPAVDFHHLQARGMGGSRFKDSAWNLIPLTRKEHIKAEDDIEFNTELKEIHFENIKKRTQECLNLGI